MIDFDSVIPGKSEETDRKTNSIFSMHRSEVIIIVVRIIKNREGRRGNLRNMISIKAGILLP